MLRFPRLKLIWIVSMTALLVQCSQIDTPYQPVDPAEQTEDSALDQESLDAPSPTPPDLAFPTAEAVLGSGDKTKPAPPVQLDLTKMPQMTPAAPVPIPTGAQALVDKAVADLAVRLSISMDQIVLIEAKAVTWPDSSLGCPQQGMVYAQVLTDGFFFLLEANGLVYEYHASRGTEVVYCENPQPPVLGTPIDH